MSTYTVNPVEKPVEPQPSKFENDLFNNKAHYLAFKARWKQLVTSGELKPSRWQFLLYNLLRNTDPKKGFTEPTNQKKLDNGYMPYNWGYTHAKVELHWKTNSPVMLAYFNGLLTEEMMVAAEARL